MKNILLLLLALASCKSSPEFVEISKDQYGDQWPFTVKSGRVMCIDNSIVFESNGIQYGVNGVAQSRGYKPLENIWLDDPDLPGAGMGIGFVLDIGQVLCSK